MRDVHLVVISGPSGSGKSTAIKALEDTGYFCVDNMPVPMIRGFMDLVSGNDEGAKKVALVVDVREGLFLKDFITVLDSVKKAGYKTTLIYLEGTDEVLVRRFSETRRSHPLAAVESPLEGLVIERKLLKDIKFHADRVIDTSAYNVHELRDVIRDYSSGTMTRSTLTVNLVAFGFRYGIPAEADLLFDVRFIPNPFFVESMRNLDGRDGKVRDYVLSNPVAHEFLEKLKGMLSYLLPLYWKEGKSYLTVAIGCTGGKHRSVAICDAMADTLKTDITTLRQKYRDIEKA
ncbi:MAG: RNase adapter RapZ [Thermodesulfobacteriota bacterium]